jgi:hypothetical protein
VGLQLPGELTTLLNTLGQKYPEADETKLIEMGRSFVKFGDKVETIVKDGRAKASTVWADGESSDIAAFKKWWTDKDSPVAVLDDVCKGMVVAGTGMMIVGGIVLLLKIGIIHQLVILAMQIAQAIAKAPATWGASLAEIPIFQQISRKIIENLIQEVATKLING